jgi:16S rRNA (uracil1498-N3)-methyltransferase
VAQAVPRLYCPTQLAPGASLGLPAGAARHVQVLRMQPGGEVTLFNGEGGQWQAVIERMGRTDVDVRVSRFEDIEREANLAVHVAVGLTAIERLMPVTLGPRVLRAETAPVALLGALAVA